MTSRIIIQKVNNAIPGSIEGLFFVNSENNGRFIIEKGQENKYNFFLFDEQETRWHFLNLDDYPCKIYCFPDTHILLKWAGEQGIRLFRAINTAKKSRCLT